MTTFFLAAGIWLSALRALNPSPPVTAPCPVSASSVLSDDELSRRLLSDPASLGSMSIGTPGSGLLINSIPLPESPHWEAVPTAAVYATAETVAFVSAAIGKVRELFPDLPRLRLGDMSDADGGRLKRHATHQGGRDVDFGFYYKGGPGVWYTPGTAANLDVPRNWALVRALLTCTDVEAIFLDTRIQRLLYAYAVSIGEDRTWLDGVFQFSKGAPKALIQHVAGHRTHYHVRFYNREAQELGRRAYPLLVQMKRINPPVFTIPHVVRAGETLGHLAARYGSSVKAIQQANGLTSNIIRAGRTYRIPLRGTAAPPVQPIDVPARRLPPFTPDVLSAVEWPTLPSLAGAARRP